MKKQNKISITVLMIFFMVFAITPNLFIIPSTIQTTTTSDSVEFQEPEPKTSQFIPRTIRVAIYNEPNTTAPSYALGGGPSLNNNYTGLLQLLQGAGYQVDELTCDDIYNHKLTTADYDVFVMVDNLPKVNITNYVKEFWLGGGAILSFDSAILYLCYYGILMSESVGDHGSGTYYSYTALKPNNISSRHPATKDYQVNDKYSCVFTNAYLYWDVLLTKSVGGMVTKLANTDGNNNWATAVALERTDQGGRIVQLPGRTNVIGTNMSNLIIDAIDWLCPRPKGRILFDLSHLPYRGIDSWDEDNGYVVIGESYNLWRDNLVNRSYTFDKLYPSASGNLTTNNLAPYDVLIVCWPGLNFTGSEISVVTSWVNNGGSLLTMGDNIAGINLNKRINDLFVNFDLKINLTNNGVGSATYQVEHPIHEGCTELSLGTAGKIVYSGDGFPIWGADANNIFVGGQEYGNGRIILISDINILDNTRLNSPEENLQFSINVINWLTASQAEVLIYVDGYSYPGAPTNNAYREPVPTALNDLGVQYYLTFNATYLNLSLAYGNYKLVIIDNPRYTAPFFILDEILTFVKNGGHLIISTWLYAWAHHPLWDYSGCEFNGDIFFTPQKIYVWDTGHPIFNFPANYGINTISTSWNYVSGLDTLNLTVFSNATSLAGLTASPQVDESAIILGGEGRVLTNAMLLSEYYDDTDNSTYPDALEIWENEIAFMLYQSLSVHINTPHAGDVFDAIAPDFSITTDGVIDEIYYTLNDGTNHPVTSTTGTINQGSWDALLDGSVSLKFYVEDTAGSSKYDAVSIDKDTQAPIIEILSPTSGQLINTTTAPNFTVNITDDHLDKMWYTVDAGLTNFTFNANGTINQAAWDALSEGTITIRFYANDTLGHESFKQVSIVFDLPPEARKRIPGYDTYLIIGVISVISVMILEKRLKHLKLKN